MRKVSALQAALSANTGKAAPPPAAPVLVQERAALPEPKPEPAGQGRGYREGKVNISAYLSKEYRRSLRMVHAITDRNLETLMAEALNDLFAKYDVPQVRED